MPDFKEYPMGFEILDDGPIDKRFVVEDLEERNNLESEVRFEGLFTYVKSQKSTYQLQDGIDNENWVDITAKNNDDNFSGNYQDLVNKPDIPASISDLNNDDLDPDKAYVVTSTGLQETVWIDGIIHKEHDATFDYGFKISDSYGLGYDSELSINAINGSALKSSDGTKKTEINAAPGTILLEVENISDNKKKSIEFASNSMRVLDQVNNKGLEYVEDYSSAFTDRSLIDLGLIKTKFTALLTSLESEGVISAENKTNLSAELGL